MDATYDTSRDLQISSATDPSNSGTSKGMQIDLTARQTSCNLVGGTGVTLTRHSIVGPFIEQSYVHANYDTSRALQISSAVDPNNSGTSKGIQIDSAPWQTSSILTDNTGATLSAHANVRPFIAAQTSRCRSIERGCGRSNK
eukprot:SAG31_NODE_918_length_11020_cov_14.801392_14_plen_142_part_00